ncbi:MAG: DNA alkylation repair protein [Erysipelotrichaceae bacterium]|nr:DNA alkylation repair protein [Erysipelotrichaceae bacterium]
MINKIHSDLMAMKDDKYRDFSSKIIRTSYPVIGVRLPDLRSYAKTLSKQETVRFEDVYYEEVLLHGIYIVSRKVPFNQKVEEVEGFLSKIDSWGICDSFVPSFKEIKKHKEEYYPVLLKYLDSEEEYTQRYALVVLLDYYIEDTYLDELYRILKQTDYHGYYSRMAAAWLLSYLFMFYFDCTLDYVKNNELDGFVYKKGIRKALDSYRLNNDQKEILRRL